MSESSKYTDAERGRVIQEIDEHGDKLFYSHNAHGYDVWVVDKLCEANRLREIRRQAEDLKRYDLERVNCGYNGFDHEMQEWPTGEWVKYEDVAAWLKKAQEA